MKSLSLLKKGTLTIGLLVAWLLYPCISFALQNPGTAQAEQGITYPKSDYGTGEQRALIEKGEYLAKAGDCIACHTDTKHNGVPFAGGLGINTPFGTFYTPNITPDKQTGIGNWTDDQFIKAMTHGVMPNGSYYFPVFPYTSFTKVSRTDLLAIKAYLFSLQPVRQTPPENDVPFPFSWRFAQLGWRILFFRPGEYQYDNAKSKEWNRGAYLVDGLEHCGMCHTPINLLGAPRNKYYLRGGMVDNYYAFDITGDALKKYTIEQIVNVFTKGELLTGGPVKGPMAEVNNDSLKYLSPDDLRAIAIYLKTVKSAELPKSSGKITADTGRKIYTSHCAVCHGTGAAGAPKIGDVDAWQPRLQPGMAVVFQKAINGFSSMPPKGTCMSCSDDEVKAAVQYLVDESKPGAKSPQGTKPIILPPKPTMADGKRIYNETCSVCHAQGLLGAPKMGDEAAWEPRISQNMEVLFVHAINGYKRMPPKGTCISCSDADVQAAVEYMVSQSTGEDYSLW